MDEKDTYIPCVRSQESNPFPIITVYVLRDLSQMRYVHYFERSLEQDIEPVKFQMTLLRLVTVPILDRKRKVGPRVQVHSQYS